MWSVSFNWINVGHGSVRRLLPNADSVAPCPQFGCKLRSSRSKFLACIFAIVNLIMYFLILELRFRFSYANAWFRHLGRLRNLSALAFAARDSLCRRFVKVDRGRHAIYLLKYYIFKINLINWL